MKNHHPLSDRHPAGGKNRPVLLIFFTLLWFFLTMVLFKVNTRQGTGWGQTFLSQATNRPNPGLGLPGTVPGAMPSPTLYVPNAPKNTGDYLPVSFSDLSGFFFWNPIDYSDVPDPAKEKRDKLRSKVPTSVLAFNGKKVAVTGFMIPLDEDQNYVVKTFVLAKSQMTCCYGATPLPNEWLFATVAPGASKVMDQMDVPLTVLGTLSVDAELKDPGMPTLYKMTVDKVEGPGKHWF